MTRTPTPWAVSSSWRSTLAGATYKLKFNPLWSLSETEQAAVDQTKAQTAQVKAQTAQIYVDMQAIDPQEVRHSLASDEDFNVEDVVSEDEGEDLLRALYGDDPLVMEDIEAAQKNEEQEQTPGNASAEGHIQQVPQVRLQHQLLDALHEVVPVFQVTLAGSVHPSRGPAKQQGLRDVRQRRQHIAGCVDYVPHPAELSHLEVIALCLS